MYEAVGPPHSFIHVDDFATLQELVDYMKEVGELELGCAATLPIFASSNMSFFFL